MTNIREDLSTGSPTPSVTRCTLRPATAQPFPTTASGFLQRIEACGQLRRWRIHTERAEPHDRDATRQVFTLDGTGMKDAYVAAEFGMVLVTLDGWYWLELNRLHENYPAWSWRQQIEEKSWCTDDHLLLRDALIELFPPSLYCARACPS
jgi:hypothetical protein